MSSITTCYVCQSSRLLNGTLGGEFELKDPKFEFTLSASPRLATGNVGIACLDCGAIYGSADAVKLRELASRFLQDGERRRLQLD